MKFNNDKIEKIKQIINRLKESGLKINQMLNILITVVLPRLDSSMMNSIFSKVESDKLDLLFGKRLTKWRMILHYPKIFLIPAENMVDWA
jgi:hypothetical protein